MQTKQNETKETKKVSLPIAIFDVFDSNLSVNVLGSLLFYENFYGKKGVFQDPERPIEGIVKMYINSPGGQVLDLMSIIDAMNNITLPIETYCLGMAASCAAVLLSSGMKGKRFIGKNSHILLHQISTCSCGQIEDAERDIEFAKKLNEQILTILAKNTGKKKEDIRKDMDRDLWLNAKEALAYGLVDKILDEDSNEIKGIKGIKQKLETKSHDDSEKKIFNSKLEIKSIDEEDDVFRIEGYASVFDIKDLCQDIVCKGAFSRTLNETCFLDNPNERSLIWNHDLNIPIGKVYLEEDSKGLFIKAELPKDDVFVSGRVIPQMRIGSIQNLSFGYQAKKAHYKGGSRYLTDIELFEITMTTLPMLPSSKITNYKSLDMKALLPHGINIDELKSLKDINNFLHEHGFSNNETEAIMAKMRNAINQGKPDDLSNLNQAQSQIIIDRLELILKKTKEK